MNVFIIEPSQKQLKIHEIFIETCKKYLEKYSVFTMIVDCENYKKLKNELKNDSLVIVINETNKDDNSINYITEFLKKAIEINSKIWPIAFNKDSRIPYNIISNIQSYDIWEELRRRNLNENYISSIAMLFSRKIIAMAFPTLYDDSGEIFISHRRIDGEEIAAKIYDMIEIQDNKAVPFRDVVKINVGDEAQVLIDKAMENSEVFIFIHTNKSCKSDWILKELSFAVLRNIPILWIQIDNADIKKLKIKPSDNPHLKYKSSDFENEEFCIKATDEILQKCFELIMSNSNSVFDYIDTLEKLFYKDIVNKQNDKMIYNISVKRKGYHYPQRNIEQCFQIFGRMPTQKDIDELESLKTNFNGDSVVILSNKIINYYVKKNIIVDQIEDFYYYWNTYINGKKGEKDMFKGEIIISGAFPDCDEIYKQNLTDALIIFAKAIMKNGYTLVFGAHPTFQELFFEIAKNIDCQKASNIVKMFISDYFIKDVNEKENYKDKCQLIETEKKEDLNESLYIMRKKMIQRKEVKAIVCLGGKIKKNKEDEGIREEIKLAIEYNIPVFIVGSVGGCSSQVAKEYKINNWKFLNNAKKELNEQFFNSFDYFNLSQSMINFIENKN